MNKLERTTAVEITYRHEYLTGFAMAPGLSQMNVAVMAQNHGPFEEHVRVLGIAENEMVLFDSGDPGSRVEPHSSFFKFFHMVVPPIPDDPIGYRVRILTTSTNLILSVGDPIGIGVLEPEQGEPIIPFPYYGPNDFVVHTLPVRPPHDFPPGPVENALTRPAR
jgi:hypothetical protein